MAAYFLDTSALAKRYVAEMGSAWLIGLTEPAAGNTCWLASVARVELIAALYRRVRDGSLTTTQVQQAEAAFRHELSTHFLVVPISAQVLDRAMELVARNPLRVYDAVQLAVALRLQERRVANGLAGLTFLSADQDLNSVATAEGLAVDDPGQHP